MLIREDQHGFKEGHCIRTHALLRLIQCSTIGFSSSLICGHEWWFDKLWIFGLAEKLSRSSCWVCTHITQMFQRQNPNCSAESGTCSIRAKQLTVQRLRIIVIIITRFIVIADDSAWQNLRGMFLISCIS